MKLEYESTSITKIMDMFQDSPAERTALETVIGGGLLSDIERSLHILREKGRALGLSEDITKDNASKA